MSYRWIAHIIPEEQKEQPLYNHLRKTAEKSSEFAEVFGGGRYAYLCGMYHDIGKYSEVFQRRIRGSGEKADHSAAGAKELFALHSQVGKLLAYCIAGHHTGLPNGGSDADTEDEPTLAGRLRRAVPPYDAFKNEVGKPALPKSPLPIRLLGDKGFTLSFLIRMLYSCLTDGDFLDTEEFMQGKSRAYSFNIAGLTDRCAEYLQKFMSPSRPLDVKRTKVLNDCTKGAFRERGLYTLTVPTGGGKTLSSLAFALTHAKECGLNRVIYAVPYNSIIEQNAAVFKEVLGEKNVLEHHSNFNYDDFDETLGTYYRLGSENWDMPVIVTTNVQFFESLFANKSSGCRKLHNIAGSVIVFDEAQMLPIPYLLPCIRAISELVCNYRCTAVLCSATQPVLTPFFPKELQATELCEQAAALFGDRKKVEYIRLGEVNDEELAARLNAEKQVLCIVNSRKQTQNLYALTDKNAYHLSTYMVPLHRKKVLNEIRERLKKGLSCRVVSTSLIEAGVDIDFPTVYRAEAGLDSMIQAAGRCNREGKLALGKVYLFTPEKEYRDRLPAAMRRPAAVGRTVLERFGDPSAPGAIEAYFNELFTAEGEGLDSKHIVARMEEGFLNGLSFPFETVASEFNLIEENTRKVVIPKYLDQSVLARLRAGERSRDLQRKIQQAAVNVYPGHYTQLHGRGALEVLDSELAILTDETQYSDATGLNTFFKSGIGIFI